MKVRIRGRHLEVTAGMRAHAERAIEFAFGRFSARVERVEVFVLDVNGPRGGVDKCCRVAARLRPNGLIYLEETAVDLYAALDRAIGRAGRSVGRRLEHCWRVPEHRRGQRGGGRPGRVVVPLRPPRAPAVVSELEERTKGVLS